ncbi:unnamed protein product [Cylicocyclus nassatus]|uniref:MULE transposase domain-containing protein n=1 Tax=Cylicocyclus nassatus TaxID=53992 RepID=A0AA36M9U7_CYLNA|nr:unnamed protein product [Cylicocyclus nassatus]
MPIQTSYSEVYGRTATYYSFDYIPNQVTNDRFHSNLCLLQHRCLPAERCRDKASRVTYKSTQTLRSDKDAHKAPTYRHYSKAAEAILEMDWKTDVERRQVLQAFAGKDYNSKRTTFARAAAAQKRTVLMSDAPEDLRELTGGEEFLGLQNEDLHIYFSEELVRIPILYAVSRFKTLETYKTIFALLNGALTTRNMRIILDYEKAAIRAAREVFPEAIIEGCAFHLAQAWNRRSADLGLRRFVRGPQKISVVANWWKTLKGHIAHEACRNFLNYLRTVWLTGVYANLWCKWEHEELRTTNIAEAFHSKLRTILSRRINPPFEELLDCIREQHTLALAKMLYAGENNTATKSLRSRDRLRREKINAAMAHFKEVVDDNDEVAVEDIVEYCLNMSRYVSEKLV